MSNNSGKLIIISAPSGTGKDSVINRLREFHPEIALSVSATTRSPRVGEVDGESYHFLSKEHFQKMVEAGDFLEYAEYIGEYYGTPSNPINNCIREGRDVILEIEVQGAKQIMSTKPNALTIFIVPPDMEELERRLRKRGTDSEEKLAERLERAKIELDEKKHYKHIVVNDDITRAAKEISVIIGAAT